MTVTGEKKKRRRNQTPKAEPSPEKKTPEYTLVYKNPRQDTVKPRQKKPPRGEPICFIMQQKHIYDDFDDDTI